ncbi:unnamed protein product [Lactuca virosa]|uniref:Uncharacterized protein n=1 Tax=Lactuca virosa TaxID=75947 RepID=A0AAU9MWA3_9ASTR|nr:unnamed protein product [Lactuca virosa]
MTTKEMQSDVACVMSTTPKFKFPLNQISFSEQNNPRVPKHTIRKPKSCSPVEKRIGGNSGSSNRLSALHRISELEKSAKFDLVLDTLSVFKC